MFLPHAVDRQRMYGHVRDDSLYLSIACSICGRPLPAGIQGGAGGNLPLQVPLRGGVHKRGVVPLLGRDHE